MRRVDWRGLPSFNELTERQAIGTLYECCSSSIWALRVAKARPFSDDEALLSYADLILAELTDADLDEALAGHPRIGDRPDNASSTREQSGVTGADPAVLAELKELNKAYDEKFGHVYLVFANGRPAAELLAILKERMRNDPATERRVLRMELAKINRSRLQRMLTPAIEYVDD
ncbi:putative OHCU decarboxylase [Gordonia polyisoprenivorans VH2]|uniref:2-oxo-4-hydroxy-4-carboxy-5-ureidoimidazoline decarboxylase n=1 Tax=Gordonia polyisoprenivorans (strain DSM 44266 / VH2) TaxID=1112204 RepID=H6MV61_GORPV|nr:MULTISPECIES: 2-oxo-4-hydroxy-4-carboxy-5-ureidoimidazoline decarboxylase [Gordonia]AFA72768.1 putative OHCU decarboxylase [Gordonia polyisoprenivorans VH2]MDF3284794.1 2-oxo-4-hydroxy-4-carboxy-5-ureidoimidazoline decarboxylase [Gordonia sp. N1V]OPX16068.1 2-oxo-4-hydroxy-4-carboxy-5-ureidoimidazoline decarboxylase [Gordonia sp. i37]OZC29872.1 OHCU decarboxylase [Gordonia polyisoprenivorans]QUD81093.1 2-oxo-4-hydroxy-4-carboxy-5-ureidoimidazoline decarboxylase [Gordonia polyisoprenivorans]